MYQDTPLSKIYLSRMEQKTARYLQKFSHRPKKIAAKLAFWNLKFCLFGRDVRSSFSDKAEHVVFDVCGGIGDLVINARYINAFARHLGDNVQIDILSEEKFFEANQSIFRQCRNINRIITAADKYYDLFISLVRFPVIKYAFADRLSGKLRDYINRIHTFHEENPLAAENDFLGRCYSLLKGRRRENQADIDNLLDVMNDDFKIESILDTSDVLQKFNLAARPFITVQTGAGFCFQDIKNETRQWPAKNYEQLVRLLKADYPQYEIVQIGDVWQEEISGIDKDLRGQTSFEELMVIVKNAKLHISQEGGIPILRHFLQGGTSVVLFGPTDEKFFGFPENINLSARACPLPCEWIFRDWMKKCMKTGDYAECMRRISPEEVFEGIKRNGEL